MDKVKDIFIAGYINELNNKIDLLKYRYQFNNNKKLICIISKKFKKLHIPKEIKLTNNELSFTSIVINSNIISSPPVEIFDKIFFPLYSSKLEINIGKTCFISFKFGWDLLYNLNGKAILKQNKILCDNNTAVFGIQLRAILLALNSKYINELIIDEIFLRLMSIENFKKNKFYVEQCNVECECNNTLNVISPFSNIIYKIGISLPID